MSLSGRQQPTDGPPWFAQMPLLTLSELLILGKCIHEHLEAMEGHVPMEDDEREEYSVLSSILTAVREAGYTPNLRTR